MISANAVYGPPGCGKTTEMLRRVVDAAKRFPKNEIAFLSFTKAGAAEALKRLNISRSDKICTIHSMMFRLTNCSTPAVVNWEKLNNFGAKTGFRFKGQTNDTAEQMETGDQYLSVLSKAENMMTSLQDVYYDSGRPGNWAEFEFFAQSYREWKAAHGYLDFNDMLIRYSKKPVDHGASIIFVDEAQDLSDLQWRVIDEMIKFPKVKEVHIAGDDDQAIYEWSGANTHGMAAFEQRYKASRTVLTQSWRVPRSVHTLAVDVVNRIDQRVDKEYSPRQETGIVRRFSQLDTRSFKHGDDVLMLCRSYITRKLLEDDLVRERIPFRNEGGMPSLFNSRVADAIRVILKIQKGESISPNDLERLTLVATDATKSDIAAMNLQAIAKRGHMRSLKIRPDLVDFYRDADFTQAPTIRISTIHSAKGREADHVILHTGLTQKTIMDMETNADAECRVWYVGVTRARHTLDIIEGDNGYDL